MTAVIQVISRHAQQTFQRLHSEDFSEYYSRLKKLVAKVSATDVNLSKDLVSSDLDASVCKGDAPVTYIPLWENSVYSMGIFVLKKNARIPLHDHPGMYGMLKVIHGKVRITSFSPQKDGGRASKLPKDMAKRLGSLHKRYSIIPAKPLGATEVDAESEPCILNPIDGNIHEIGVVDGPAAFLDILAPPYDMKDRDCHYYMDINEFQPQKDPSSRLTYLIQIPPPSDFWCDSAPYLGPKISVH